MGIGEASGVIIVRARRGGGAIGSVSGNLDREATLWGFSVRSSTQAMDDENEYLFFPESDRLDIPQRGVASRRQPGTRGVPGLPTG